MLRYLAAVTAGLTIAGALRGDDAAAAARGALGSGARIGTNLSTLDGPLQAPPRGGALSQGLGQVTSGWARDGIHGSDLAERVHQLQQARAALRKSPDAFRDRDDHGRKESDRLRDLREDRREIARDQHLIRNDERRLADDRAELRRDLADYRRDRDRTGDRHGKTDPAERQGHDRDRDRDGDHLTHHERDRDRDRDGHRSRETHVNRDGHGSDQHNLASHLDHNDHGLPGSPQHSPSPSHPPEASHHAASDRPSVTPSHAPVSKGKGR